MLKPRRIPEWKTKYHKSRVHDHWYTVTCGIHSYSANTLNLGNTTSIPPTFVNLGALYTQHELWTYSCNFHVALATRHYTVFGEISYFQYDTVVVGVHGHSPLFKSFFLSTNLRYCPLDTTSNDFNKTKSLTIMAAWVLFIDIVSSVITSFFLEATEYLFLSDIFVCDLSASSSIPRQYHTQTLWGLFLWKLGNKSSLNK